MKLQLLLFCLQLCVESFCNSEKCPSLFLAGNKLPVQASKLQQDKNISASEKLRPKHSETKCITLLLQTNVKGQWW